MARNLFCRLTIAVTLALCSSSPSMFAQAAKKAKPKAPQAQTQAPAPAVTASPLPPDLEVKRLILKDDSYQPVSKIEVVGDRVRYLSAERGEWEEIPSSLIDWAATEKYAREGAAKRAASPDVAEIDAEEQSLRKKQEALAPEVSAGLHLPETGGVFLLDVFNGQAQLNELKQSGSDVNRETGRNVLRATVNPLAGQKQHVELKGQHARVQSHESVPYIYINVDEDESEKAAPDSKDRFRVVRAESVPKRDVRVVGTIKVPLAGKVSQEQKYIPSKAEVFSGPWIKVTPVQPLPPGEYAVVEVLPDNQINLYVWDFGVNPSAPANPGAWVAK